eukprot:GHVO01010638.1.p1 GENE.GHVO01010638.1~~GHVO01010638.1.p1  ORF type:complete len:126 (+),score=7.74 GHVO01010638.1:23-379(+)
MAEKYTAPKSIKRGALRLFSRGTITSYRRAQRNQDPSIMLVDIEGVQDRKATDFYLGKKVAFMYKAKTLKNNSKIRVIWGKVRKAHGNNGVVRAKFRKNLPPSSLGRRVRVMLYPSTI